MTDLRAVEPMYRPAERPAPSKPRRRVVLKPHAIWIDEEVAAGRVTRWRSDTPILDALAWHARVLGRLLSLALLAAGMLFVAWALLFAEAS